MTKIHSNKINFVIRTSANERKYSLISGEFHVKYHSITSGQPDEVANGDTLHFDHNGEFNFRAGRKSSKDVARWFNGECNPKTNTTFGHSAKKLNFAFMGTLRLKIAQEIVNHQFDVKFEDILIAQGSSGATNNWWFGGKTCTHISSGQIVSNGSTVDGNNFRFTFLRGSKHQPNNVHTVEIVNIEFFTWMKLIDENKFLSQINIPGTHDSGTYNFDKLIFKNYVTTQNLSIRGQLDFGIRFLDIRCRHINNSFTIHHDRYYCNLVFGEVLNQCISFLQANPSECIVMLIKEEYKPKGNSREFYQTFLNYVNNIGSAYWYDKKTIPRLKDVRRKIVLLHRFKFNDHAFGINAMNWPDNKTFKIKIGNDSKELWIQDQYSVTWTQKAGAIMDLVNESNKRENFWYLNYISLAPTLSATITSTSNFTNAVIYKVATNTKIGFLGMVIMDFPNMKNGLTSCIIDNNQFFKYHLYPEISINE